MRNALSTLLLLCALTAGAQTTGGNGQADDSELHLTTPKYFSPYGVPDTAQIKAVLNCITAYLEKATPATTDSGRLHQGTFRLTSYEWGVTYSAMIDATAATGDSRYRDYAVKRLGLIVGLAAQKGAQTTADPQLQSVVNPKALDDAGAMATALLRLQAAGQCKAEAAQTIARYVDYVMKKQYRLTDGIFARNRPYRNSVWLDDMFMGIPCLAWYGKANDATEYLDEAARQILLFKERMWVPSKQLFRHGWVESMRPHPAFFWGRANGWALLSLCEVLDALPDSHPLRAEIAALFSEHVAGLAALQDKTGFWHQLLDSPDTYLETSCTAIYCYCMAHAIRKGWIDAQVYGPVVLLAWNALSTKITADGQVMGTCVGSGMGFDKAFYACRPVSPIAAHGYGPVVWAASEVIRLLQTAHPKMNDSAILFYQKAQNTKAPIFSEE